MAHPITPTTVIPQEVKAWNPLDEDVKVGRYDWYRENF
jgi:hypothetical protein